MYQGEGRGGGGWFPHFRKYPLKNTILWFPLEISPKIYQFLMVEQVERAAQTERKQNMTNEKEKTAMKRDKWVGREK